MGLFRANRRLVFTVSQVGGPRWVALASSQYSLSAMPIKDNSGKVIVSLLAGATAGIVAGLLLAPETGDDTRQSLAQQADKLWNGHLGGLLKGALARLTGPTGPAATTPAHPDQQAAEALLHTPAAPEPGDLATPAGAGNGRSIGGNDGLDADRFRL